MGDHLNAYMAGLACGVDGSDYGMPSTLPALARSPLVVLLPFCPEHAGLGTPRTWPDIEGGDGFDVLDGDARVVDPDGEDLSAGMRAGAQAMVDFALTSKVDFALLVDMSAACGSQVISDGVRFQEPRRYQRGVGVATAALLRAGIHVVSHRDFKTLAVLHRRLDPLAPPEDRPDHHEHPWVLEHLPESLD